VTRRALWGGIELDDDPSRLDLDVIVAFLRTTYWGARRPVSMIEGAIRDSHRVVGLYDGARQIGFARAVSDGHVVAYLADVYVLPGYRGRGLGAELVGEMIERGPLANVRWMLHTKDAHDLYRRFGFHEPDGRALERDLRLPD